MQQHKHNHACKWMYFLTKHKALLTLWLAAALLTEWLQLQEFLQGTVAYQQ